ncbi:macrophage mannose receptor 1-like [Patiria miniata]|uniref:C-type lectin domain-containing protein n=1 Tax=Patiria miniata TaxID=46514 RepID=A0A913Z989_PATMI|nr:macrophage mannose receptor 1-like [Patiria miniata]
MSDATTPTGLVACPTDWIAWSGRCYHRPSAASDGTWDNARAVCQAHGGDIITVRTASENRFLSEAAFGGLLGTSGEPVWLGCRQSSADGTADGNDNGSEFASVGGWQCLRDKEGDDDYVFTNWRDTFPVVSGDDGDQCAVMMPGGYWENVACSVTMGTVCELQPEECKVQDIPGEK